MGIASANCLWRPRLAMPSSNRCTRCTHSLLNALSPTPALPFRNVIGITLPSNVQAIM